MICNLFKLTVVFASSGLATNNFFTPMAINNSGVQRNFVRWGGGGKQIQLRTGGGSPLVRGSGGSCNFIQEISFHTVKSS